MLATIAIVSLLGSALASPVFSGAKGNTSLAKRDTTHCGTTTDGTLSDCQALVTPDIWNVEYHGSDSVCTFTNPLANVYAYPAYNLACHGNCCVYYTTPGNSGTQPVEILADQETLRQHASNLLSCGDTDNNKVNGLLNWNSDATYSLCMSDHDGCGDCFDDADYAFNT